MGNPKQLLKIDEETLIRRVTRKCIRSVCFPAIVVIGASHDQMIREIEDLPVFIEYNPDWEKGMSSSIRKGLETLESVYPTARAVILTVADQPFLSTTILNELVEVYEKGRKKIIASEYSDSLGTPTLFDKKFFPELKRLRGDKGARKIIEGCQKRDISSIKFAAGETDIDTMEDYLQFQIDNENEEQIGD